MHQDDCIFWNGVVKAKTYPIFRYAEVLLGYVEAMNEMEGSYTDEDGQVTVTRDVDRDGEIFQSRFVIVPVNRESQLPMQPTKAGCVN